MNSKILILAPVAALALGLALPVLAQAPATAPQALLPAPATGSVSVQFLDANATPVTPAPAARRGERHADADGIGAIWQRVWHDDDDDDERRGRKGDHHDDDDDDDDDGRGGPQAAPAGSVAPPKNGLFVPGGAPAVVTK